MWKVDLHSTIRERNGKEHAPLRPHDNGMYGTLCQWRDDMGHTMYGPTPRALRTFVSCQVPHHRLPSSDCTCHFIQFSFVLMHSGLRPTWACKGKYRGRAKASTRQDTTPLTSPNSHLTATTQTSHPLAPMDSFALFSTVVTPESEPATGPSIPIDAILDGGTDGARCVVA